MPTIWAEAQTTLLLDESGSMYGNDPPREVAKLVDGKIRERTRVTLRDYIEPGFSRFVVGLHFW